MALVLAAVVPWTDFVGHSHWGFVRWVPFVSPPIVPIDLVGNVMLFIPFGGAIALNWSTRQMVRAGALAFTVSLAAEWAQVYCHNRFPSSTDIICNVVGALIGVYVYRSVAADLGISH